MTEQQAKCCGTCWWWIKYRSLEGGWCQQDGSNKEADECCLQWERGRYSDYDEEEVDDGP
jgi:hypothetical protein